MGVVDVGSISSHTRCAPVTFCPIIHDAPLRTFERLKPILSGCEPAVRKASLLTRARRKSRVETTSEGSIMNPKAIWDAMLPTLSSRLNALAQNRRNRYASC